MPSCGQNGLFTGLRFKMPEAVSGQVEERIRHTAALLRPGYLRPVERKELHKLGGWPNAVMRNDPFCKTVHHGEQQEGLMWRTTVCKRRPASGSIIGTQFSEARYVFLQHECFLVAVNRET